MSILHITEIPEEKERWLIPLNNPNNGNPYIFKGFAFSEKEIPDQKDIVLLSSFGETINLSGVEVMVYDKYAIAENEHGVPFLHLRENLEEASSLLPEKFPTRQPRQRKGAPFHRLMRMLNKLESYGSQYQQSFLGDVLKDVEIPNPLDSKILRGALLHEAGQYEYHKDIHDNMYSSPSKQNATLEKIRKKSLELYSLVNGMKTGEGQRLYEAWDRIDNNDKILDYTECTYDAYIVSRPYHKNFYDGDPVDYKRSSLTEQSSEIIDKWQNKDLPIDEGDFYGWSDSLALLSDSADLALELDEEQKIKKSDALFEWVMNIGLFWREHFDTPFTYDYDSEIEDKDKSNKHLSIALDVLMKLIKPIDSTVRRENMAYIMQQAISELNKIEEAVVLSYQ